VKKLTGPQKTVAQTVSLVVVVLVLALTFTKITSGDFELPKANEISQ